MLALVEEGLLVHTVGQQCLLLFVKLPKGVATLRALRDDPDQCSSLTFETSLQSLGQSYHWELPPGSVSQVTLPMEQFAQLFLSERVSKHVQLIPQHENQSIVTATRIVVSGPAYQPVLMAVTKGNNKEVGQKLLQAEQNPPQSKRTTAFPLNYTFPLHALPKRLQEQIRSKSPEPEEIERDEKARLTPAHKIYDRILNDPTVEEDLFDVGYLDRFTGIKEVSFKRFVTLDNEKHYNTSVPFHRVRFFKYKGQIVWNRDTRLNLIDGNGFLSLL
jgi:uncharacterized protein (UPF0248 family)